MQPIPPSIFAIGQCMAKVNSDTMELPTPSVLDNLYVNLCREYRVTILFNKAREVLGSLYELCGMPKPKELDELGRGDNRSDAVSCLGNGVPVDVCAKPPSSIRKVAQTTLYGCSTICETVNITVSGKPPYIEFFELVESCDNEFVTIKIEDESFKERLNNLLVGGYAEVALEGIENDEMRLRRLWLLRYTVDRLQLLCMHCDVVDGYLDDFVGILEEHIEYAPELLKSIICPEEELYKAVYDYDVEEYKLNIAAMRDFQILLETSLASLDPSEAQIIYRAVENLCFMLIQKKCVCEVDQKLPFMHLQLFKKSFPSLGLAQTINNLITWFEQFKKEHEKKRVSPVVTVISERELEQRQKRARLSGDSLEESIGLLLSEETLPKVPVTHLKNEDEEKIRAPAVTITSESGKRLEMLLESLLSGEAQPVVELNNILEAFDAKDFNEASKKSRAILDYYNPYKGLQIEIPADLMQFFSLVEEQIALLINNKTDDWEVYRANLARLSGYKENFRDYMLSHFGMVSTTVRNMEFIYNVLAQRGKL